MPFFLISGRPLDLTAARNLQQIGAALAFVYTLVFVISAGRAPIIANLMQDSQSVWKHRQFWEVLDLQETRSGFCTHSCVHLSSTMRPDPEDGPPVPPVPPSPGDAPQRIFCSPELSLKPEL